MKKNILFAGLFLLLAACSKDKNADTNISANTNTVYMRNSVFSPSSLQVNINVTVTWMNDDNIIHSVTADDGSFDSGDVAPGATFTHTFSHTGTYNYHCIHVSGMAGSIVATGIR
jgi:plastocyanin